MVTLRLEQDADWEFVVGLYSAVRAAELAPVGWPEQEKAAFLRSQCELQRDHYRRYYVGAQFSIIERSDRPIGRLYVQTTASEVRLMDIALLDEERGHGTGTSIIAKVLETASAKQLPVTLHVEPDNPAQRLYGRFGFRFIEDRGAYQFLGWDPPSESRARDR